LLLLAFNAWLKLFENEFQFQLNFILLMQVCQANEFSGSKRPLHRLDIIGFYSLD